MLVDPSVAEANALFLFEPARDLLWAPILLEQFLDRCPYLGGNAEHRLGSPLQGKFMCLLRAIASLASIAFEFATYARFIHTNHFGDFGKRVFVFPQRINLVSLCLGKLVIGSHIVPMSFGIVLL